MRERSTTRIHALGALVFAAVLLARSALAQEVIAIEGATIIDGTGAAAISDGVLLVRGDTILGVGRKGAVDVPQGARRIDASGKTIIPGLLDVHTHPGIGEGTEMSVELYAYERIARDAKHQLYFGVTHFLSLGFDRQPMFDFRQAQREGKAGGARAYTAGHGFAPVGGWRIPVPHGQAQDSDWYNRPKNAEDGEALIRKEAARGVSAIKIWVDDLRGAFIKMTPALYGPLIQAAHRQQLPVMVHMIYLEDARELLRHDVDVFAHSVRDHEVDEAFLTLAKEKGVTFVPTLIQARYPVDYADNEVPYLADPELVRLFSAEFLEKLRESTHKRFAANPGLAAVRNQARNALANARKIHAAGIPMATGGDTGVPGRFHGLSVHIEMELMTQAGMSALEAIQAATLNGARVLKIDQRYGSLASGKAADFVILDADPRDNIANTRRINAVWMNGSAVNRNALRN